MLEADLYLACLVLSGRNVVVVGAGKIGLEKIEGLLACDAAVTVVAPEAIEEVRALVEERSVEWRERPYRASDLEGAFLVVAATSDTELNTAVFRDAEARSMLVNVVDVPDLCNFILPAIIRAGPLAIGISTSGASPALAKRIKREVAAVVGPEHAELAVMLDALRPWAKETLPTYDDRRDFFERIVNGDPDPVELLRAGDRAAVEELFARARRAAQDGGSAP